MANTIASCTELLNLVDELNRVSGLHGDVRYILSGQYQDVNRPLRQQANLTLSRKFETQTEADLDSRDKIWRMEGLTYNNTAKRVLVGMIYAVQNSNLLILGDR